MWLMMLIVMTRSSSSKLNISMAEIKSMLISVAREHTMRVFQSMSELCVSNYRYPNTKL